MKIDRTNCEAWFLDYYEGVLSKEGVEEMYAFLILNPDMREMFDSYDEVSFSPDNKINFTGKNELKKVVEVSEGINESNCEEYFVGAIENVLNAGEKKELENYLSVNPGKQKELELLRKTILTADTEVVFENKNELKKSTLISEENFEEFAVAAMEGELSGSALLDFNSFLETHPEQKKEFALFSQTKLQPDAEIVFEGKASLKKTPLIVTSENFEEIAISSLEGLLNREEEKLFVAALAKDLELKKAFGLYSQTKLETDHSVVFEDKASLKRKKRGGFWWMADIRFAAAASVALLLGIFWWTNSGNDLTDPSKNSFAKIDTQHSKTIVPIPSNNSGNSNSVLANNSTNAISSSDPIHQKTISSVVYMPSPVVNEKPKFTAIAFIGNSNYLKVNTNMQVDFSDAFYTVDQNIASNQKPSKSISPMQYAMRWTKNKLDRSAEKNSGDEDVYTALAQNKNENVNGFDLTSSALNALGEATGSNLKLSRESSGTVLTVGKYNVWLNRK